MQKILLIGNSPLPNENVKVRPAAGLRTWQFVRGLGGASVAGGVSVTDGAQINGVSGSGIGNGAGDIGFEIKLVTIAMPECYVGDIQKFKNQSQNGFFEPKNEAKSLYVQTSVQQVGQFGKNSENSRSVPGHNTEGDFGHIQLSKDGPDLLKKLQKIHDEYKPEVIVAINTYPSFIASRLKSSAIFWADLNGWIMAEAQAQAHKMASNDYLFHYTEMEESILRRADKFSVVSEAQKFAVLGELASIGRLCAESFGYEFCEVVNNGLEWFEGEKETMKVGGGAGVGGAGAVGYTGLEVSKNFQIEKSNLVKSNLQNGHVTTQMSENGLDVKNSEESKSLYGQTLESSDGSRVVAMKTYAGDGGRGAAVASSGEPAGMVGDLFASVPRNAFVVLWMGGYNTWVDEVTLFKGVEAAMQNCENLYFVSTGGEIEGLDNKTFANFKAMIDGSQFRNRFVFLGWVDTKSIPYIYKGADVGLNVDKLCVETLTGARNRINEMMKFGLPIITTLGSEISYEVMRVGAGIGVISGKSELLSEAIVRMWRESGSNAGAGGRSGDRDRGGNGSVDGASGGNFANYGKNGQQYIEKFCNYAMTLKPLLKWLEHPVVAPDRGVVTSRGGLRSGIKYLRENGVGKFLKKLWQKIKM